MLRVWLRSRRLEFTVVFNDALMSKTSFGQLWGVFSGVRPKVLTEVDDKHRLWPLMATITINKLRKRSEFHGTDKRAIDAEESIFTGGSAVALVPAALAEEPVHDDEVALLEELDVVCHRLASLHREIVMRTLAGDNPITVAEGVDRTERTFDAYWSDSVRCFARDSAKSR